MRLRSLLLILFFIPSLIIAQNHLLISEIEVSPSSEEFIEIFNPNPFPVALDSFYLSDYNTYYRLVVGDFSTSSSDFLVKFPAGATIDSAGVLVVALDGANFSGPAQYEIRGTSSSIPDMDALYVGSSASLANSSEMVMLFYWDGISDLVKDVDYAIWGSTTSNFVDKSGISIDGPDGDSDPSTYLNDTPVTSQVSFYPAPISGKSMTRISLAEVNETFSGGNGISGHDETSEDISQSYALANPTPGSTDLELPSGSGSGVATVSPDSVLVDSTVTLTFTFKENIADTLTKVALTIPASWSWSGNAGDVSLSAPGFSAATVSVVQDTIFISQCQITQTDSGVAQVAGLQAPHQPEISVFTVRTVAGGALKEIENSPRVVVWKKMSLISIREIQQNTSAYLGQQVMIEGVVTLGAGITTSAWTDTYVQDTSGYGINVYQSNTVDTALARGNRVRIIGTVDEYNGVTEIIDYTVQVLAKNEPLPAPLHLSTAAANGTEWEGTYVEVQGQITDMYAAGGGTNIKVNDGSGECTLRIWDTAGLNLNDFAVGDLVIARGPLDIYNNAGQVAVGYQEDIQKLTTNPGDGSGIASVTPDSVGVNQSNLTLTFSITGEDSYVLETLSLTIPSDWQWSQSAADVSLSGAGFTAATATVQGNTVQIAGAAISSSASGQIIVHNLTSPNKDTFSTFSISTATAGGVLTPIANPPRVQVGQGVAAIPISEIQLNTANYLGQQVTILGVVTLGAGVTTTSWTDAYVQDKSGYGINVFQSGSVDAKIKRGNLVVVTGTVEEYNGVTEITNYTAEVLAENQPLPTPLKLQTVEATGTEWEGTFVEVQGEITDMYSAGGGTNIIVDDGSGPCTVRIWDTAGLNLTSFAVGDTVTARGPLDIYNNAGQVLVGYQEDITKPGLGLVGDGSGFATLDVDSLNPGESTSVTLALWSNASDTLRTVHILMPFGWQWSGSAEAVQLGGPGLQHASVKVALEYGDEWIQISDCQITGTDTGYVSLTGLTTPEFSVYSYFWIKTAVQGGVPQFIAESPFVVVGVQPVTLIKDVQTNSGQFKDPVTLEGVVTVGAGILRTDRTTAYMQDISGYGIQINKAGAPDTTYRRGWWVKIQGTVSEYRQTTQITPATVDTVYYTGQLPQPIELTTAEANSPRWDGTLIQVRGVVTEKYSTSTQQPYDYNVVVNDGTGATMLRVWGTTGINLDSVDVNSAVIARGVGGVYVDREGKANYQILPAYQEDIRLDPTYQPTLEGVSLEIPPHPFVPDRGERITIRYNAGAVNNHITIRIFDLAGRLVTTLLDEDAQLIVNTFAWDGRDEYHNFVPLGTYICHLEVMEPQSGKKRTRVAPIVVGTMLKK